MADLGEEIRSALDTFDMEKARDLLRKALKEPTAEIYYLASLAALNDAQRENFLKQAIELDPFHKETHEALDKPSKGQPATPSTTSSAIVTPTRAPVPKPQAPPAPTIKPQNDQPALITGKVSSETRSTLFQIPATIGAERTFMPGESEVILLTRDEKADWYNIVYTASTGNQLLGWVEANDIKDISLLGNQIEIMDLPISQFEWNSREDIDELIRLSKAKTPIPPAAILSVIVGVFLGLGGMCNLPEDPSYLLMILAGLGLIAFGIVKIRNRSEPDAGNNTFTANRLRKIKASKKPDSQKLMENQLITAAIQTGMSVGSTIITKMVPDKQEITHRNK